MRKTNYNQPNQRLKESVTYSNSGVSVERKSRKPETKSKKSPLYNTEKQLSAKKSVKCTRHLTGYTDYAHSLKDFKLPKNSNDVDNTIKLLKLELTSLMEHTQPDKILNTNIKNKKNDFDNKKSYDNSTIDFTSRNSSCQLVNDLSCQKFKCISTYSHDDVEICNEILQSNSSFEALVNKETYQAMDTSSSEFKNFSKCQTIKIDLMQSEIKNQTLQKENNIQTGQNQLQLNVKQLLYKSFLMQNLNKYFSSCDEGTSKTIKPSIIKRRKKKPNKHKKKYLQNKNQNKKCFKRRRKNFEIDSNEFFEDDIEVISYEKGDSIINVGEMPKTSTETLYLESYDWDEPFSMNEKQSDSSFLEIIETNKSNDGTHKESNSLKEHYFTPKKYSDDINKFADAESAGKKKSSIDAKKVWECPICFDTSKGQEIIATVCGHIFCKKCIETYFSTKGKTCPVCRTAIKETPFITLFNI